MSHPPFAPAASAVGAFCAAGELEGARHDRKNPAPLFAAPDLQYLFFYDRECDPNFKPRAPAGRGGEREAQILCDLAREIEPHAGGFAGRTRARPGRCRGWTGRSPCHCFPGKRSAPAFRAYTSRCCSRPARAGSTARAGRQRPSRPSAGSRPGSLFPPAAGGNRRAPSFGAACRSATA